MHEKDDSAFEGFDAKLKELGPEAANGIFKMILLRVIDVHWKEHLLAMDDCAGYRAEGVRTEGPLVRVSI